MEDEEEDGRHKRLVSVASSSSSSLSSSAAWSSELFLLTDEGPSSAEVRNCSWMQLMEDVNWGSGLSDLGLR